MIRSCSAQTMMKVMVSSVGWPRRCEVLFEFGDRRVAREQRDDRARGGAGLRAVPEARHDRANERGQVGAESAERRARQDRKGNAGRDAGVADHAHQDEDAQRSDADRHDEIDKIAADEKEARGEIIAPEAMNVGGPDVENAECAPVSFARRARGPRCRAAGMRLGSSSWSCSLSWQLSRRILAAHDGLPGDRTATIL